MKSNDNNTNTHETSHRVPLIDPSIPIEDLLGSVTTYNNVEGSDTKSLQLRTSARVFKKMKLDSALAAIPPPTPPPPPPPPPPEKKESEKKEEVKPEPPPKRVFPKPLWNQDDRTLFYEALNEFGKDFDAIHTYISTKLRKKGLPEASIKSREQVRHFYYRQWHKISKHLIFSNDVKKLAQELYGLINYGELRKKMCFVSEKTFIKLNELIYMGSLVLRIKGQTLRFRTPTCKALRRLNQLDERIDDIKLPLKVILDLKPKDMSTWMHVQELAQNPRVRMVLPLQKRLNSIMSYMAEKWQAQEITEHKKLLTVKSKLIAANPDGEPVENIAPLSDAPLRFTPPPGCNITVPTINITEYFTTQSICLNAYEERIGAKISGETLWLNQHPHYKSLTKGALRRGVKRARAESNSDKNQTKHPTTSTITDSNENCVTDSNCTGNKVEINEFIDEAVNSILALKSQNEPENKEDEEKIELKLEENCLQQLKKEQDIAKIRLGWTVEDCGTLTVGDLYLMFGSDSRVELEYCWDLPKPQVFKSEIDLLEDVNKEQKVTIESDNSDNCNNYDSFTNTPNDLSYMLKKLLSVAKLHYRKNMIKCPCGHVCGSPTKSTSNKNKSASKNPKPIDTKPVVVNNPPPPPPTPVSTTIKITKNNITTTASMVPVVIQPQIRKLSPSSLFRRPLSPNDTFRAQIDSIQRLKPRYCNRKGRRPRVKQVIVERKLPVLANKGDSGRQIVQMNIISQVPTPRQIAPKIVPQITTETETGTNNFMETTLTPVSVTSNEATGTYSIVSMEETLGGPTMVTPDIVDDATTPSRVGSPTSISNLLDIALQSAQNNQGNENKSNDDVAGISFVGLLSENITSTPPTSPSRILKENENQWLSSEVVDFSLSSFLGHLESPLKTTQSTANVTNEDTRLCLSQDVDAQLQSLLTETSLDYTAKFADLAAQVTDIQK